MGPAHRDAFRTTAWPLRPGPTTWRADGMTLRSVLLAQGGYYALTGVAPFVSRRAFEAVTGPKRDWWLVQTVGALVAPVGAGLVAAGASGRVTPEAIGIAAGCAAGLGSIDVYHATRGTISRMYLADAACQAAVLVGLARALRAQARHRRALAVAP